MRRRIPTASAVALLAALACGCERQPATPGDHGHERESWAVTAWGERYEIFAEADPLAVGETSKSHTHVTVLDGFAALNEGRVTAILVDSTGTKQEFPQPQALRPGIFSIAIQPRTAGTFDLVFRIESQAGTEEIASGRVQVGAGHASAGGLVEPPPTPASGRAAAGEPVGFLKEQQWRVPFATAWARTGSLLPSLGGPARVRAAAGGEAVLTAPLDGVVVPSSELYVGRAVKRGTSVAGLRARATSGRSLAEIETDSRLAAERLARLEPLFQAEAVSRAELDLARSRVATLRAELDAVRGGGRQVTVPAPFDGTIAEVLVTPGEAVSAGAPIARLVRPDPLWVEVGVRPEKVGELSAAPAGLIVQRGPTDAPLRFEARQVRLVSRAPEVDRATGLLPVIVEVRGARELRAGSNVQAEILLPGRRDGVVLPAEAVVDDAGVPVVYVQAEGESFERHEVKLLARQGDRVLIEGVRPGDRVVTRGAAAIRRAAQMSTGAVEGHVH